jgi:hypothetical protein
MVLGNPPGAQECTLLSFHQYPEQQTGTLVRKEQATVVLYHLSDNYETQGPYF